MRCVPASHTGCCRRPARSRHERQRALFRAGDAPAASPAPACVPLPDRATAARPGRARYGVRWPLAVVDQSAQPGRIPPQRLLR
ncbi:hypothetical protein G6F35_018716 [Rhizopus arrhizus]|nr:hypothetical protein G6F35_018716 [Rhizopus arrhizus]